MIYLRVVIVPDKGQVYFTVVNNKNVHLRDKGKDGSRIFEWGGGQMLEGA